MDNKEAKKGGVGMSEPQKKTNKGMGIYIRYFIRIIYRKLLLV